MSGFLLRCFRGSTIRPSQSVASNLVRTGYLSRSNPLLIVGAAILVLLTTCALLAPAISPKDPDKLDIKRAFSPPSFQSPFGTDDFGRDVLSRVTHGSRVSLRVSVTAVSIAVTFGTLLGLLAGFLGGALDTIVMRIMDIFLTFPPLLLAIVIAGVLGPGLNNAILAIAVIYVPTFARVARGPTLVETNKEYVQAAGSLGARRVRILFRHILPNILTPVVVQATVILGVAIIVESSLSYLGLGVQPPTASWGVMVSDGRIFLQKAPWVSIFPGLAIMLAVLAFNLLGDGLRDVLDPRSY